MSGKAKKYCLAAGCHNNDKNSARTFFALPSGQTKEDDERCRKWLTLLGRKDLLENARLRKRSYSVCCAHFDDSQIKIAKSLVKGSIPTLLLANPNALSRLKAKTVEVNIPAIVPENAEHTAVLSKTIKTELILTEENIDVPAILSSENVENTSVKLTYDSENITIKSEPISIEQDEEVPAFLLSESSEYTSISNIAVKNAEVSTYISSESESAGNTPISNITVKSEPMSIEQEADVPAILSTKSTESTSVSNIAVKNAKVPAIIMSDVARYIPISNITVKSEPISIEQEADVPAILSTKSTEITSVSNIAVKNAKVPAIIMSDGAYMAMSNRTVKSEPKTGEQEIAAPATVSSERAENTSVSNIANLNSESMPIEVEKSTQTGSFLMKRKLSGERKKKRKKQNI